MKYFLGFLPFFLVFSVIFSGAAVSQDYVITPKGKISDRDFYRLVSCGAKPGGKCRITPSKWSEQARRNVRLRVVEIEAGFPASKARQIRKAITNAISEVNGVGSGIRLSEVGNGPAEIEIRLVTRDIESMVSGKRSMQDEIILGGAIAMVQMKRRGRNLSRARIVFTDEITRRWVRATVLEEVVQGLGLPYDIHNRYYERRSMFSETDCCQRKLKGQDAKAILLHYPPRR